MSTETLKVEVRNAVGSQANRKLRRTGKVPAILYGHGQDNVNLSICAEALGTALRHHSRLVQLEGGVNESALIKDLAYDTFGMDVLHVDFARVSTDERIEVEVAVELKGTALGAKSGGVIIQPLHEVLVECLAVAIPEKLLLNVGAARQRRRTVREEHRPARRRDPADRRRRNRRPLRRAGQGRRPDRDRGRRRTRNHQAQGRRRSGRGRQVTIEPPMSLRSYSLGAMSPVAMPR
ncbi:MAG: 50S ribosomal protein L25 [Pirellulales bacterium]